MYDPMTVAHEIRYPWASEPPSKLWPMGYRRSFITIWHRDPEHDGTDDSCGWFKRAKHGDKAVLAKIIKDFQFEWKDWFKEDGQPILSVIGTTLSMFQRALWSHLGGEGWERPRNFMRKHLYEIIMFAENPTDSLFELMTCKYGQERQEDRIERFASIIYGWILRADLPWYRHPRWHVWHWRLQIHPWQALKRRYWDKCGKCGKRGFPKGIDAIGDWEGTRIWHSNCDDQSRVGQAA